jgi:hypothetical protein
VAQFLFDADTVPTLHRLLEEQGHSVTTIRQVTRLDAPDDEVLLVATTMDRLLVTHNEQDFLLLARAWRSFARQWETTPPSHAGIIVIPQSDRLPFGRAISEINSLVRRQREVRGHVFTYSLKWGWILDPQNDDGEPL